MRLFHSRRQSHPRGNPRHLSAKLGLWLLFLVCGLAAPAWTAQIEGVTFPEEIRVAETTFKLHGLGTVHYLALFKVYVGALYLPEDEHPDEDQGGRPRRLELSYLYDFKANDFRRAMRKRIVVGLTDEERTRLAARIEAFCRFFRDVSVGDRYAMTFVPGSGTSLELNGQVLGSVAGADFAHALFNIWLGDDPLDAGFRAALLGEG
jgi:hypothetical protein